MSKKKSHYNYERISLTSNVLLNIMFCICILLCVLPLLLVIMVSLTDEKTILANGYNFFPKKFSISAYTYVFNGGTAIVNAYGISIIVTLIGTALSMLCIALFAYPLSRNAFKYKGFFSFLVYFTMIFGGGLVPWVMVYTQFFSLNNTLAIMIIPYLMNAWYVLIMRTFMRSSVPEEIVESARIDGAGEFRTFFVIVAPLCVAGLATIGLFAMLGYWNDWYLPLIFITDRGLYNIQYLMYSTLMNIQYLASAMSQGSSGGDLGKAIQNMPTETSRMAIAVIAIGPIILAYPFFQKYFIKGLTIGAVKG